MKYNAFKTTIPMRVLGGVGSNNSVLFSLATSVLKILVLQQHAGVFPLEKVSKSVGEEVRTTNTNSKNG
jgi:hypothetical protein